MHKHAKLMEAYARDAKISESPWKLWQFKRHANGKWLQCREHPAWSSAVEYRRLLLGDPQRGGPTTTNDWE